MNERPDQSSNFEAAVLTAISVVALTIATLISFSFDAAPAGDSGGLAAEVAVQ
jgi:hypothetical protein